MDTAIQTLTFLIIVLALVTVSIASAIVLRRRGAARRREVADVLPARMVPAYEALPGLVGQSIEADRPILFSTGSASLGDNSTLITLAGTAALYYITKQVSVGERSPRFLTSETSVVPLGYDILRRAYLASNEPPRSGISSVRWFPAGPTGEQSLVFAAMLAATMHSDNVSGNVFVGRFGAEIALPLFSAQRREIPSIVGSDDIIGQAVSYALADGALIGEDVFSTAGYLGEKSSERGTLLAQDALRAVLVLTLILLAANELSDGAVANLLTEALRLISEIGG